MAAAQHRWPALRLFAADASAQTLTRGNLATILGFENSQPGLFPVGWGGSGPIIFADDQVFHTGKLSARIGLNSLISGIGVFYPDRRPTQRIGILPNIEVLPTFAGIQAGRDELIEEAIRQITPTKAP